MVNLLRFGVAGGREHYLRYAREVMPHLERAGATVRYAGTAPTVVIGEGSGPNGTPCWWSSIPRPRRFST